MISDPAQARLSAIATNLLERAHGHLGKALAQFSELIDSDFSLRHALAHAYLELLQRQSQDAAAQRDGQSRCDASRTLALPLPSSGGRQRDHEIQSRLAPPTRSAPRGLRAIASVQSALARSVLDTFKVRDGRAIGDVPWRELGSLAVANETEGRVLRYLMDHLPDAKPDDRVRDVVSESAISTAIAQENAVNAKAA